MYNDLLPLTSLVFRSDSAPNGIHESQIDRLKLIHVGSGKSAWKAELQSSILVRAEKLLTDSKFIQWWITIIVRGRFIFISRSVSECHLLFATFCHLPRFRFHTAGLDFLVWMSLHQISSQQIPTKKIDCERFFSFMFSSPSDFIFGSAKGKRQHLCVNWMPKRILFRLRNMKRKKAQ